MKRSAHGTVFPITWHRNCLANQQQSLAAAEIDLLRCTAAVERSREQVAYYAAQIRVAESKGIAGFDPDRFMKAKKKAS